MGKGKPEKEKEGEGFEFDPSSFNVDQEMTKMFGEIISAKKNEPEFKGMMDEVMN